MDACERLYVYLGMDGLKPFHDGRTQIPAEIEFIYQSNSFGKVNN